MCVCVSVCVCVMIHNTVYLIQCEELRHLIGSQPTSIEAVRLKTFLQPHSSSGSQSTDHTLDRTQVHIDL